MRAINENKYAELIRVGAVSSEELNGDRKKYVTQNNVALKERKGRIIDAAKTARKGYFLELPEFICRSISY